MIDNLIQLLFCRFLKESSRWLIGKGRVDEAIAILKSIAKTNGKEADDQFLETYKKSAMEELKESQSIKLSILDLFKTPVLRRNVIFMILNWSLVSLLFESNIRNIENLPYSIYVTYTIYSFLEFPSDIAAIWGLDILGRRLSAIVGIFGFFLTTVICASAIEFSQVVVVFGMIGRLFIIYSMNVASQLTLEVVPTQLRGQGSSLANVCAQISSFFAPQIVYSQVIDSRMPFIIMGILSLMGCFAAIFLPETSGIKLPDSIEEAEILFSDKRTFSCCKSKNKVSPSIEIGDTGPIQPSYIRRQSIE